MQLLPASLSAGCWILTGELCSIPRMSALQISDERVSSCYQHRVPKPASKGQSTHSTNNCFIIWSSFSFILNTENCISPLRAILSLFEACSQHWYLDHCSDQVLLPLCLGYPCFRQTSSDKEGQWNWLPFLIVSMCFFSSSSLENLLTLHTIKQSIQSLITIRECISLYKGERNQETWSDWSLFLISEEKKTRVLSHPLSE